MQDPDFVSVVRKEEQNSWAASELRFGFMGNFSDMQNC